VRNTRGDLSPCQELVSSRGGAKRWQKSAEGIVDIATAFGVELRLSPWTQRASSSEGSAKERSRRKAMGRGHRFGKFFDRVNHDVLMVRVARRISDKRVLRLIRRYLQAGMMTGGVTSPRAEGTPQGGPCRRCCQTSYWTSWIRSLRDEDTSSVDMRTTATSTCGRERRESE